MAKTTRICEFPECGKRRSAYGYCDGHRQQQKRGDDLMPLRGNALTVGLSNRERFDYYVDKSGDCWLWTGGKYKNGYGCYRWGGKQRGAHRFAYEQAYGPLHRGDAIDHICRRKACVNPDHLRVATKKENAENVALSKANTSGHRGVVWDARYQRWQAQVMHHGRHHYLGAFDDVHEAGAVAKAARTRMFTHSDGR